MKRLFIASVLAASTLWFSAPASAAVPPALPQAQRSFYAGSLRVDVFGTPNKPALVFIPGLTCGPWEWSREIARFSPNFTIYALTLPGFDGQPSINGPLIKTVSSDFWSMLDAQHINKPIVIGHSLGGTLSIVLAEEHSDKLGAVVAVDGLPIFPGLDQMSPAQRQQAANRMQSMVSAASTPAQFEAAEKTYVLPRYLTAQSDVDAVAPLIAKSDPKAAGAWMAEDVLTDARPELKDVRIPLLEIMPYDAQLESAYEPSLGSKQSYYQALLANDQTAKVVAIDHSRHFVMYDQPEQLDSALKTFLQGLP